MPFRQSSDTPGQTTPLSGRSSDGHGWRRMPLNVIMKIVSIHEHALEMQAQRSQKRPEQMSEAEKEEASWQCNGVELFLGGCKSGQTEFELHYGTKYWGCRFEVESQTGENECDFDLCEMCVRWTAHCEKTGADLGTAPKTTVDPYSQLI